MKKVLLYIWQLPQNLLGLLLLLAYEALGRIDWYFEVDGVVYCYIIGFNGGVSLGRYVLLEREWQYYMQQVHEKHEYGHSRQSRRWGWFYLVVIGIPSACGNLWDRWFHKKWTNEAPDKWYHSLPWEKNADKLGGVQR